MSKFLSGKPASVHERERFEKEQAERLAKAINITENAVKEKHMRSAIIGTWQEYGATTFWSNIRKMSISSNGIMCWKALIVIYKVLREGHPKVLKESLKHKVTFADLKDFWKHSSDGNYGHLCSLYLVILIKKLDFHAKYEYIPGTVQPSNNESIKYPTRDPNYFFELAVDIFDILDVSLDLFDAVHQELVDFGIVSDQWGKWWGLAKRLQDFWHSTSSVIVVCKERCLIHSGGARVKVSKSLNPYKSNSQLHSVQCRICLFPMLIQECSALYNMSVEIMYRLHRKLTHDMLSGHRDRFYPMFKRLQKFFMDAGALSYVTALISVPKLHHEPPTFIGAEPKPVEAPKPVKQVEEELPSRPVRETDLLGMNSKPDEDERGKLIEQLTAQIRQLEELLFQERQESRDMESALKSRISELNSELSDLRVAAEQMAQENNELQTRLQEEMKLADQGKPAEEKFNKLKQIYSKLRAEHVQLLRDNGEVKKTQTKLESEKQQLEEKLENVQEEADETSEKLLEVYQTSEATKGALKAAEERISSIELEAQKKETEMSCLLTEATKAHEDTEEKRKSAEEKWSDIEKTLTEKVSELETKLNEMTKIKEDEENSRKNAEDTIEKLEQESKQQKEELNILLTEKTKAYDDTEEKLKSTEAKCSELEKTLTNKVSELESQLNEVTKMKEEAEKSRKEAEEMMEKVKQDSKEQIEQEAKQKESDELMNRHRLLVLAVEESEQIVQSSLDEFENPKHCGTTCTAEYLVERMTDLIPSLERTTEGYKAFLKDKKDVGGFISTVSLFSHLLSECIMLGKATSHMAPREDAETLVLHCQDGGKTTLDLLQVLKDSETDSTKLESQTETVKIAIQKILDLGNSLIPKEEDNIDSIHDAVEDEISSTAELVAEAVTRIEEMLKNSRQAHTGVKLEVNERILDSCDALMKAIRVLILKAKDLQGEIVEEGMGSASAKEFYKRHHRWTEGLISAAKAVGWGAKVLVDAADKVVQEGGKFEELVVASNEVAASTAQLVAASRVKASPKSPNLTGLTTASKSVAEATGNVVASAKTGSDMIEDSKTVPDYSKLTLTQAKRFEMDSQVRVLELESQLEKERKRLGDLRRTHYQLAGASEGWQEGGDN